ncbi:alanine--tRNA ligase, mitochondrial [Macrosteles quadrilineatus]|uniref:alanine--tRNA ligase, mitochondrial n=1 Tax=Macrosteles quadrilineatus TaxID=74068 RepID=UPI0023E345A3|nr:alanine--tRNA ligase, mitochondrial [Macrosteles quadrilineatus]
MIFTKTSLSFRHLIHQRAQPQRFLSSYDVRKRFLDFFISEHSHTFIRSSPIVPLNDKTIAFINAGMNQFKDVFLNKIPPHCPTAANSQKCIRVGGKHNDLNDVGLDSYHHTFFEMLGNWSFGDYFKREACDLAWTLLTTSPYSIDPRRLYVTYFSGCDRLGIPPDLETREIWLSLGVDPSHILGFGVKDNFWEMGRTGPCGPCSEIHVDLVGGRDVAAKVNQGFSDVTELWNLVFIQFNRNEDGSLSQLPMHHVDTGMGFERLVALLQNKMSNYDTDLFVPLFSSISKVSKAPPYAGRFGQQDELGLDTAYRILADHSRMATVAISDNMYPDNNHKLRRVIRKALSVAESSFKVKDPVKLMKESCSRVSELLSHTYPETGKNLRKVHLVVEHEWQLLRSVRDSAAQKWHSLVLRDSRLVPLQDVDAPGMLAAYNELSAIKDTEVLGDLSYRLFDTHGLHPELIEELCQALGLQFSENDFNAKLAEAKEKTLTLANKRDSEFLTKQCLDELKRNFAVTDDSAKYNYDRTKSDGVTYVFPEVEATVQAVLREGKVVEGERVTEGERVAVVLDRTCLYHEAGGQQSDTGVITGEGWILECDSVLNCEGYLLHLGCIRNNVSTANLVPGSKVRVSVTETRRVANMCNHTATHCLNAMLRQMYVAPNQKGSSVTERQLTLSFSTYGQQVTSSDMLEVDRRVQAVVSAGLPVSRTSVSSSQLMSLDDVTLLPGETYPSQDIHLIQIIGEEFVSKEPCCGTHVANTADIGHFCLCSVRSSGSGVKTVTALTGKAAVNAREEGQRILDMIGSLRQTIKAGSHDNQQLEALNRSLQSLKQKVSEDMVPYDVRIKGAAELEAASKELKEQARESLRQSIEREMKEVLKTVTSDYDRKYFVHFLQSTSDLDKISLQKVTRMCPTHLPVIIFAYAEGELKARCCVPKVKAAQDVSAEKWMSSVVEAIRGSGDTPRGQDPRLIYNLRPLRVSGSRLHETVRRAVEAAEQQANKLFS